MRLLLWMRINSMNSLFNPKHDQALTNLICLHRHSNNHWLYAQIKQPNHWRSCHWGNDFVYHLYFYAPFYLPQVERQKTSRLYPDARKLQKNEGNGEKIKTIQIKDQGFIYMYYIRPLN